MLVCNISARPPGRAISVELAELATAVDASAPAFIVIQTLVDDPASAHETINAFTGQILRESANASDSASVGFVRAGAITEALTANSAQDASIAGALTTFNPADLSTVTLTNGNLTATCNAITGGVRGTKTHTTGKYYWEYTINFIQSNGLSVGICLSTTNLSTSSLVGAASINRLGSIQVNNSGTLASLGTRAVNDVIGVAVDFSAALIWMRVAPSGLWNNSGTANPATGVGGISISAISTGPLFPVFIGGGNGDKVTANFGATAFTGAVPSGFTSGF